MMPLPTPYSPIAIPLLDTSPYSSRNQLGQLLNSLGLHGQAVEVGTHQGRFAKSLLEGWTAGTLYCIDPWTVPPGYEEQWETLPDRKLTRAHDRKVAEALLGAFIAGGRCRLIADVSPGVASRFGDETLDLVYLDGDHETAAVAADLDAWWPKVRSGGILAGHDLVCPGETFGGWAGKIQPAVFNFFAARPETLPIRMIVEEDGLPWSFYVVKP